MPHVIYLQSSIGKLPRGTPGVSSSAPCEPTSLTVALGLAGVVNAGMLTLAAVTLHDTGPGSESLDGFHAGLGSVLGPGAGLAFALVGATAPPVVPEPGPPPVLTRARL